MKIIKGKDYMYIKVWKFVKFIIQILHIYIYLIVRGNDISVYGKWDDVTANDLFQVQIDCKYRKEWDTNSVQLYVVDSDAESNSDVLYWEFLFPVCNCA